MPESNAATTNLGSAYFLLGRFEDAASAWEDALSGAPTSTLYSNPGSSYFFLGRFGEAAETYQKSLALAPEGFEGWGNLADAYKHSPTQSDMAVPNYRRAIALAEQHLKINPSDAVAIAALAHYQACVGKREEALENVNLAKNWRKRTCTSTIFLPPPYPHSMNRRRLWMQCVRRFLWATRRTWLR